LVSPDKGYTPLNLSDNIISDIVEPNIPDTIANKKEKSLHGRYFKELEQPEINIQASHAWLKNQIFILRLRVLYLQYKIVL
jgi:alpha-ketoglutarate-dependent taurine dioxygenase